jgi:hypothetical protein
VKLVIIRPALAELQHAAKFYAKKANAELGLAMVAEFESVTELMLANPLIGAIFNGTRR